MTSRVDGVALGGRRVPVHPDRRVGQRDLGRVEADQPAGGRVPAVVGRVVEALVELVELVGVEQQPHGRTWPPVSTSGSREDFTR